MGGVLFEAYRLAFIQKLLNDEKHKMDPLIGQTSSLVLTLCGVLKSIAIIIVSVLLWGTVVTPVQVLGNAIAFAGLVYYQVGAEKIHSIFAQPVWSRSSPSTGKRRSLPIVILAACCFLFFATAASWWILGLDKLIGNGPMDGA
ncbi:MAG: hypothetical protein Q9218_003739 [Villophora microphyllina]